MITCGYVSVDEINKLHLSKLIKDVCSTLRPIGVVGGGSIPLAIVGSIALLLTLLHYVSSRLVSLVNEYNKEVSIGDSTFAFVCGLPAMQGLTVNP